MQKVETSKGTLQIVDGKLRGTIKATTSMQQAPMDMAIDTPVKNVGPISIGEVIQFRWILSSCTVMLGAMLAGICALCGISGPDELEVMAYTMKGVAAPQSEISVPVMVIAVIIFLLGIAGAVVVFKKLRVYMAQFSNAGQTVYVPFLKEKDRAMLVEFDAELAKYR